MRTQVDKARALVERFGGAQDGAFAPSGLPIAELAERFGTPFYLYDAGLVAERVRAVAAALGTEVCFSIKANPSLAICQVVAAEGAGAEVASAGELAVALEAGFGLDHIVFAGPGKTDEELTRVVEAGILADNVESLSEIERLARIAGSSGRVAGVGLRINPAHQLMGAQMRMGGTASQFGIDEADLAAAVERVRAHSSLHLRGIHVYTATQIFAVEPLLEHCAAIFELALHAADLAGEPLAMIDFGGGFGVPYFERLDDFDLAAFGTGFRALAERHRADPRLAGCRLMFELGRYLVADAGIYVTRVVDVKATRGTTFAVTDGGMNHHLTATGNMGQVFRKPFPILNLTRAGEPAAERVSVVGPLCTPLDTFGTDLELAAPRVGDLLGVFYSGAYGYSASNLGFLSHPTPAEVVLWRGEPHLVRPAGTPEDVLRGQAPLPLAGA